MRTLTTVLYAALVLAAAAQYRPFPGTGAQWTEQHAWLNCCGTGSNYVTCTRRIHFGTDTVIDGLTYHEMRIQGSCNVQYISDPWPPYTYEEADTRLAFIRQDLDARRVYAWTAALGHDTLLYDFNIGVGPYPATYISQYPDLAVTAVDSVQLSDGWHRRWKLNFTNFSSDTAAVIEGIGSTLGVFGPLWPPFEWSDDLVCFTQDSLVVYTWSNMDPGQDCALVMSTPATTAAPAALHAYPNPFTDAVRIDGAHSERMAYYRLLSSTGALIMEGAASRTIQLPADLRAGLWLLEVYDRDRELLGRVRAVHE